ncbi:MAG: cytochrome c biogenesis protein CcsA [Verrucomicrobiota bacterium]
MNRSARRILFPVLGVAILIGLTIYGYRGQYADSEFNLVEFGKTPVQNEGRIQPMDSVARNSLLLIHGERSAAFRDGERMLSIAWLAELLFTPEIADNRAVFRVPSQEVRSVLGRTARLGEKQPNLFAKLFGRSGKDYLFSYQELSPHLSKIQRHANQAKRAKRIQRSHFQREVIQLWSAVSTYQRLKLTLRFGEAENQFQALLDLIEFVPRGKTALENYESRKEYRKEDLNRITEIGTIYQSLIEGGQFQPIPTDAPEGNWEPIGNLLTRLMDQRPLHPSIPVYARLIDSYRSGNPENFNAALSELHLSIAEDERESIDQASLEYFQNRAAPFEVSTYGYAFAFLAALFSWRVWPKTLNYLAFSLLCTCFAFHTIGILQRAMVSDNLPIYSQFATCIHSAWVVVMLGISCERIFKNNFGNAAGSLAGFSLLIVAHQVAELGPTLSVVPFDYSSSGLLAAHILAITLGQAAGFFAGAAALAFLCIGLATRKLGIQQNRQIAQMLFGITCFGTLFMFAGALLGGAWSDQTSGQFWTWDPKENGALMLVIWFAIAIHCRWAKLVNARGLAALSLAGSAVATWSWFGADMLSAGYQSEIGPQNNLFPLFIFVGIQLIASLVCMTPRRFWPKPEEATDPAPKEVFINE